MAPAPITEDYYMVLEVEQTATPELIIRSYKRLALKLHPDRNAKHDATEAFQLLGKAYETLKDESKRRAYDLIYPSIKRCRPFPQNTQTPRSPPTSTPKSEALNEAAQIAALEKLKQDRSARWWPKKTAFDSSIFELQRNIRRLEQEIKSLDSLVAAAAAQEAQKKSWGSWLISPIYKKVEDSEEEKASKDRERQERTIEKDMKERRLALKKTDLKEVESRLKKAKEEVDAANKVDDEKIRVIQDRIPARESRERVERERVERERIIKIFQQMQEEQEKREREAAEALRKRQAEERAAAQKRQEERERRGREAAEALRKQLAEERAATQKRQEEAAKRWQKILDDEAKKCWHDGWWSKIQGRTACPECGEVWTYLLQCPGSGCTMKACPRCQAAIRRKIPRNVVRNNQRAQSQSYLYDEYDWAC